MDVINEKLLIDIKNNLEYYIDPIKDVVSENDVHQALDDHDKMRRESERIVKVIKNSLKL